MKRLIFSLMASLLLLTALSSCNKDSDGYTDDVPGFVPFKWSSTGFSGTLLRGRSLVIDVEGKNYDKELLDVIGHKENTFHYVFDDGTFRLAPGVEKEKIQFFIVAYRSEDVEPSFFHGFKRIVFKIEPMLTLASNHDSK